MQINLKKSKRYSIKLTKGFLVLKGVLGVLKLNYESFGILAFNGGEGLFIPSKSKKNTFMSMVTKSLRDLNFGVFKEYKLVGVGYKCWVRDDSLLYFLLGFSHFLGVEKNDKCVVLLKKNRFVVFGFDRQLLGNFCHILEKLKKVDVYKGKGVIRSSKVLKLKEGKTRK